MNTWRWLDNAFDYVHIGIFTLMAGVAFGIAYGWFSGVCVAAGFLLINVLVACAMKSVARKSRQTKVPRRSVPQKKFPRARGE